jgi:hypothetical protein
MSDNQVSMVKGLEKIIILIIIIILSLVNIYYGIVLSVFYIFYQHSGLNWLHFTSWVEGFETNKGSQIPKIIIQTWKTENIPEKYRNLVDSVKQKNPDYEYKFFTDLEIETFLRENYPQYYETYSKLPIKIQKIDFFRYIAIYHYGGFYFDLDMNALQPLDSEILQYDCVFPVDEIIKNNMCNQQRYQFFCKNDMYFLLGQYAFGAKPKNPFIKQLVDSIHNNIDDINKVFSIMQGKNGVKNMEFFVYSTTGPDFVSNEYLLYDNKKNVKILDNNTRQFFGKYAQHNYFGTWK